MSCTQSILETFRMNREPLRLLFCVRFCSWVDLAALGKKLSESEEKLWMANIDLEKLLEAEEEFHMLKEWSAFKDEVIAETNQEIANRKRKDLTAKLKEQTAKLKEHTAKLKEELAKDEEQLAKDEERLAKDKERLAKYNASLDEQIARANKENAKLKEQRMLLDREKAKGTQTGESKKETYAAC